MNTPMSTVTLWLFFLMAFMAGAFMPVQAGINGLLARELSSTLAAATLSFLMGTLGLLLVLLLQRESIPLGAFRQLQWWHLVGGFMGAFFVFTAAFAAPRIGALLFMALVLAGQMSSALFLDHQGWLGFRESSVTGGKVVGMFCIVVGVWLIRRG